MSPRDISAPIVREIPLLREDMTVEEAVRVILDSGLPALPVVDGDGAFAGIFGEREFMTALFPGYVRELRFAGFVSKSLDEALEKRAACRREQDPARGTRLQLAPRHVALARALVLNAVDVPSTVASHASTSRLSPATPDYGSSYRPLPRISPRGDGLSSGLRRTRA